MSQRKHAQLFDCFDVLSFDKNDIDAIVSEAKSLGAKTRAQANELILLWAHDRFGIKIVDTLDGVRIVTQNPVVDETYPASSGYQRRVRIQVGVHGMSGEEALIFARSRHGSSDFDRASRQQQVITAIRAQADVDSIRTNIVGLISSLKDALKNDRARIQVGRISPFGLMEMSRQRIRSSVLESSTEKCPICAGSGHVRSVSSVALQLLRTLEETRALVENASP